jgi:arginyl-tRNA--protein-N-Asp/Glu arginylyltransferase
VCAKCRECVSIRVPVESFTPDKSQRRCWKRNADLAVTTGPPNPDKEAFGLYQRYLSDWHGDRSHDAVDRSAFENFLYDSPVETIEFRYRDQSGKLRAVGLCDVCERSLSSVYFYFDPAAARRGLGTFGALRELAFAREISVPYYYLGYWIERCGAMSYKSNFRPYELLDTDGVWRRAQWTDHDRERRPT